MNTPRKSSRAGRNLAKSLKTSKAPAISRAAAVLRLLGESNTALSLQSIAGTLDLVPSTCLYVLRALVAEELVAFDPDSKRYTLEAGVLTLARDWLRRNRFTDLAQPALDRLSQTFGVSTLGVNIVGLDHIIVVATSRIGSRFQLSVQTGSRFPALISATGRCIAAFGSHSENEIKARFKTLHWDNPPDYGTWLEQVEQARERGLAIDSGNYILGVTVIAAPIWKSPNVMAHALVAIGIGDSLTHKLEKLQKGILKEARDLTAQLGGSPA